MRLPNRFRRGSGLNPPPHSSHCALRFDSRASGVAAAELGAAGQPGALQLREARAVHHEELRPRRRRARARPRAHRAPRGHRLVVFPERKKETTLGASFFGIRGNTKALRTGGDFNICLQFGKSRWHDSLSVGKGRDETHIFCTCAIYFHEHPIL